MKHLFAVAAGTVSLVITDAALAQAGHMMDGGMSGGGWRGGYACYGLPVLLVVVAGRVVGLVVWVVMQRRK
jgi:hypothetical protein